MATQAPSLAQLIDPRVREGELWEPLPEGRLRCYACGHRCVIPPGQRGVCKVRYNTDGRLLVPWGYVAGLQLDPVEKKPFFHAYPGSKALSFGMLGCDLHCSYCFPAETPVLTATGAAPIGAIFQEAGEAVATTDGEARFPSGAKVITASGDVRPVSKAFRHPYRGPLLVVQPMYLPAVRCTPDHRWLATTDPAGRGVAEVPARELTTNHFVLVPRLFLTGNQVTLDVADLLRDVTPTFSIPRSLSPEQARAIMQASEVGESSRAIGYRLGKDPSYVRHVRSKVQRGLWVYERAQGIAVEGDTVRFPNERRPYIARFVPLDKTLARLLGFYCAEGSVARSGSRPNSLSLVFSFGHTEERVRQEVRQSLEEVFGVRAREARRSTTTAVTVSKASLAWLFGALCGTRAARKRVPAQVFDADAGIREAFLEAYLEGDGHEYPGGKCSATTVSRGLAYGVAALALGLGYLPSVYIRAVGSEGRIQGRSVRRQPEQFSVVWYRERGASQRFRETDTHFLVPVKSVTTEAFEGDVYNLEVEEEHSYLAGFCAVKNCQNALTSQALRDPLMGVPPQDVTPEQVVAAAERHGARILTSTYNEPLITSEWAVHIFKAGKAAGLVGSYVSNGNATPEVLDYIRPWVDLYKIDLKGFDDRNYRKLGGLLQNVLDSVKMVRAKGFWLEIVTLVVPGFNDSDEELGEIARFIASVSPDIPWHVTAFHQDYKMRDRENTSVKALLRAAEIGVAAGLNYVYAGNLPGRVAPFEHTYCPTCKTPIVERVGYRILKDLVTPTRGVCPSCGTRIAGRWG